MVERRRGAETQEETLAEVAALVARGKVVAFTGAGMSTESGIPDFRSPGGLWTRYDAHEYASLAGFRRDPEKVWTMLAELEQELGGSAPNPGHFALAGLERDGLLDGVITQNIDGLHQAGGSQRVVEFHGGTDRLKCLDCGLVVGGREVARRPPPCPRCGAIMKPDIILFGEPIEARALEETQALLEDVRTLLVCGTSAEVQPASQIPYMARAAGAAVVEVNLRPALPHTAVTHRLLGKTGELLPALLEAVRGA